MAWVFSFSVSRPVLGSVTPKQVLDRPLMRSGSICLRCSGVANFETGWVASTIFLSTACSEDVQRLVHVHSVQLNSSPVSKN